MSNYIISLRCIHDLAMFSLFFIVVRLLTPGF